MEIALILSIVAMVVVHSITLLTISISDRKHTTTIECRGARNKRLQNNILKD